MELQRLKYAAVGIAVAVFLLMVSVAVRGGEYVPDPAPLASAVSSYKVTAAGGCECGDGCQCNEASNCGCVPAATYRTVREVTYRSPIGHTHTCARGHSWDHDANPTHVCRVTLPNGQTCGLSQYVQDPTPRMVSVVTERKVRVSITNPDNIVRVSHSVPDPAPLASEDGGRVIYETGPILAGPTPVTVPLRPVPQTFHVQPTIYAAPYAAPTFFSSGGCANGNCSNGSSRSFRLFK